MVSQNANAALQNQMQNVRESLSEHADEAIKNARREFDWRNFVANHPWTSVGAAASLGFFLVPRRACYKVANAETVTEAVRPRRSRRAAVAACRDGDRRADGGHGRSCSRGPGVGQGFPHGLYFGAARRVAGAAEA